MLWVSVYVSCVVFVVIYSLFHVSGWLCLYGVAVKGEMSVERFLSKL